MKFKNDTELPQAATGGSLFVKLKDGDSITGVFRGAIFDFMKKNDFDKEKPKDVFRFRVNFITSENGALVAKIFEAGIVTYKAMRALSEQGYDLEKTTVVYTRKGTGTDTEYSLIPAPPAKQCSDEQMKQVEAVKLHDLAVK